MTRELFTRDGRALIVRQAGRVLVVVLLVLVPFAGALTAIAWAPAAHVDVAGYPVAVKPVLGQDTSRLENGALIRPEHAHIPILGRDVGVDVDADWNRIIPSDKQTRRYLVALWSDPDPEITRIQDAARTYLIEWSVIGFLGGAAVVGGVALVLAQRRRRLRAYTRDQRRLVVEHNRRLRRVAAVSALALVLGLDVLGVRFYLHQNHHPVVTDPSFEGTTLAGTEATGLISDILPFLSILQPRSSFYDSVSTHLKEAIAGQPALTDRGSRVAFVLAEDFEDVNGMARQVGLAAQLVDADFIAFTGDLTFAGKAVESYLIDTVDYYSENVPVYLAPGLHDTDTIVDAARDRGWHIADGRTERVAGLSLLTVPDPRISTVGTFGVGDVLRDLDVDVDSTIADTVEESCATRPDFVILHDHILGADIAKAGCQRVAVLDGRSYEFVGPQRLATVTGGHTIEFTSGSAGGHTTTRPDPGVVKHPARFSILTCDPDGQNARYFLVSVLPDASVTVSPGIDLRVPYAEFQRSGQTDPGGGSGS